MSIFGPSWRDSRCGHHYEPDECPYDKCALKEALAEIARLTISRAASKARTDALLEVVGFFDLAKVRELRRLEAEAEKEADA